MAVAEGLGDDRSMVFGYAPDMRSFFRPNSRMTVTRGQAMILNSLNILAPALLFLAIVLAGARALGGFSPEMRQLLLQYAAILVLLALLTRMGWGAAVLFLRRRRRRAGDR